MEFTVLRNSEAWLYIPVAIVTLGVSPILAGWFSRGLYGVALFPLSGFLSLSVASLVFGGDFYDVEPIPFLFVLSLIWGGLASVAFLASWGARIGLAQLRQ